MSKIAPTSIPEEVGKSRPQTGSKSPSPPASNTAPVEDEDDDNFSWGTAVKADKLPAIPLSNAKKINSSSYQAQRQAMKDRIVEEVLDAALPDSKDYDMDDIVMGTVPTDHRGFIIKWLKFFGVLDLNVHEAVLSGSLVHAQKSVKNLMNGKKSKIFGVTLKPNPPMVNAYDEKGQTALSLAAKTNRTDMVDLLVYTGRAIVDYIDNTNGMSPLMYAILNKNLEMTNILLNNGASVRMCDFKCKTPLMYAAQCGILAIVELLTDQFNAEVDLQDENGLTALHYAVYANKPDIIRFLLEERGANRHIKDYKKKKPLHMAIFLEYGDCAAVLEDLKSKLAIGTGEVFTSDF